jgi:hypothetical protein
MWRRGSAEIDFESDVSVSRCNVFLGFTAWVADAPDLGLQNHRFQSIAFRFEKRSFHEGKTGF